MEKEISTVEILNTGMQCLIEHLGIVEAEHFISVVIREQFDYTKWQSTSFDKMEPEEFNEAAARYAKEHPYTGNAKVIL